jgi:ATP-dependent 26S proteasome regulatory subunit
MNALMQFLDGVNSPNNVIFVATTNYINELDPAFVRAGRFDLKLEVKGLEYNDAISFCKSFELNEHDSKQVIDNYKKDNPNDVLINQAKLQGYIINKLG